MTLALTQSRALAAYASAKETGIGFEEAADMLAACLAAPKARKPKASPMESLQAPIKVGRRAKHWSDFVITWADGSLTLVRGVIYDRPADRWAAAFQAADRLRRLRARHGWEGEAKAPARWHRVSYIKRETPEWWAYVWSRPMPEPVTILGENGETYETGIAPDSTSTPQRP